ncbi:MAG: glycosyltransferase family 2 protein [Oscillospiraceae bacterium]|jgi:cellulose synthase/poly-beta-1,6-N-acetylglucosamine synthase-like glycosyltransferase|nr:glycosyltransferase family 2 protein [Oscillospiraceae bacterium]
MIAFSKFVEVCSLLLAACYSYQTVYMIVALLPAKWFNKRSNSPFSAPELHSFAVLIAARNEESVLPELIRTINSQTYPAEHVKIFVIADNCTDGTAAAARRAGAVVYERQNCAQIGKGHAINSLLTSIKEEFSWANFDAYLVIDADNLLEPDFIEQMNVTFSEGHDIITSYRNTKNYGPGWIAACNSLWFIREAKYLNIARKRLHTSCAVSGTGFLFSQRLLCEMGGWHFNCLTEDIEFISWAVANGYSATICEKAVLYDEQPTKFLQSWRQRKRWARGAMQVMRSQGGGLVRAVFKKHSFAAFDMLMATFPIVLFSNFIVCINIVALVFALFYLDYSVIEFMQTVGWALISGGLIFFLMGFFATITEWKKIRANPFIKILTVFTFPLFMLSYTPITFAAILSKTEWKPIVHNQCKTLEEVSEKKGA